MYWLPVWWINGPAKVRAAPIRLATWSQWANRQLLLLILLATIEEALLRRTIKSNKVAIIGWLEFMSTAEMSKWQRFWQAAKLKLAEQLGGSVSFDVDIKLACFASNSDPKPWASEPIYCWPAAKPPKQKALPEALSRWDNLEQIARISNKRPARSRQVLCRWSAGRPAKALIWLDARQIGETEFNRVSPLTLLPIR